MDTLGAALEREHREIDAGIAAFTTGEATPGAVESLTRAMDGLRRHIYLEEEFLFPPLRAAGMMAPVFVMLREHGELWATLDAIEAERRDGAASTSLLGRCGELTGQLESHNAKEEPILYAQADGVLTASASADLQAFMDTGQLPEGWVCTKARV